MQYIVNGEWFQTQPLCLIPQHVAECHVCSLTATGLAAYFTCHSALKPAGDKMAEYASSSSSVCSRQEGRLMDENGILSLRQHSVEPLNIYPSISPSPASISLFVYLILSVNWFSGERIPSGGQAHGGVWCPDWHYSAEEADHWQQDQGGEGEVNTRRGEEYDSRYHLFSFAVFIPIVHFISPHLFLPLFFIFLSGKLWIKSNL